MLRVAFALILVVVSPSFAISDVFEGTLLNVADGHTITVLDSNLE